jgi:5-methyltetrahydrofolate--homocysteine methyltransferase
MKFLDTLRQQVLCIDGATGTMIQSLDLGDEYFGGSDYKMLSDLLTFSTPNAMRDIHLQFFRAGACAVETNSFGASPLRLAEYDFSALDVAVFEGVPEGLEPRTLSHADLAYHLSRRSAEIACDARRMYRRESGYNGRALFVMGSMGPSNRVLSSTQADLAVATFDEIQENFRVQTTGLLDGGADVLLFETQQDILELKAAILGAKQAMAKKGVALPIVAQVTVDQYARMQIFHTDIHAAQVTVDGMGVDVFGINCSIGPDLMAKSLEKLARYSPLPISVVPNAGLPRSEGGKTVFDFDPARFGGYLKDFVEEYGVAMVGGCCGTTPDHIRCVVEAVRDVQSRRRTEAKRCWVSGPQEAVLLDGSETLIRFGERLNVRGSKKVRDAVENNSGIDHDVLEEVVRQQVEDLGCEILDVCMDSNQVDTVETLKAVVHRQTANFPAAMSLDSFQVDALEEAIKVYPGRCIINSVSMEEASPGVLKIDAVMDATKAHNPLYVGLCTGPKGPGATREEKLDLAVQIIERARNHHGVTPERLFIDVNVFPIGSEPVEGLNFAEETLEAIAELKAKYPSVLTTLGVGNLTNGLAKKPYMRKVLTSVFLEEARKRGLDAAIINPNHYVFMEDLDVTDAELGHRAVMHHDMDAYAELEVVAEEKQGRVVERRSSYDDLELEAAITEKIKDGFKERKGGVLDFRGHHYEYEDTIVLQVAQALEKHAPLDFINQHLMRAMQELGDGFGRGEVSLPHLLKSADVMRQAMGFIEAFMHKESGTEAGDGIQYRGTVVVGTVYQDVHSIGKDLARTLLENYGYKVIDLGTMAPLQEFIDHAKAHKADAIGMSALLVQTSNHMITVAKMMVEQGLELPLLLGGAPVSPRHAAAVAAAGDGHKRGDVFYCRTAMDGVNVMNTLTSGEDYTDFLEANQKKLSRRAERAEEQAREEQVLLDTLPRRTIEFASGLPPEPRFAVEHLEIPLRDFAEHIDTRTLFALNWRFGGQKARERSGHNEAEMQKLFEEWIARAADNDWLRPQGVFGLYPCHRENDELVLFHPETPEKKVCRLAFSVVIGAERDDIVSGAQYFRNAGDATRDVVGLQITTAGAQVDTVLDAMREESDSESALFLQGLADRIAEDMADYVHHRMRTLLGLGHGVGQRWSPGYPGMRDLAMNQVLTTCLNATDLAGVGTTSAGEYTPTSTTGAVVSFHPEARYT